MATVVRKVEVREVGHWEVGPEQVVETVGKDGRATLKYLPRERTWVADGTEVVSERTYKQVPCRQSRRASRAAKRGFTRDPLAYARSYQPGSSTR